MKNYIVSIPIAGFISIEVQAEDKESAEQAAWNLIDEEGGDAGDVSWDFLGKITAGNVCHAPLNETSVDEIKGKS